MVAPLVWLIVTERLQAAFWLFLAAAASDAVDGFIAKNFNARTNLGSYLDPLADKVLLIGIYLALAMGQLAAGVAGGPGHRAGSADRGRGHDDPAAASGVPAAAALDRQDQHAGPDPAGRLHDRARRRLGRSRARGRRADRRGGAHHAVVRRRLRGPGAAVGRSRSGLLEPWRAARPARARPAGASDPRPVSCSAASCCRSWSAWPRPICSIRRPTGCSAGACGRTVATLVITGRASSRRAARGAGPAPAAAGGPGGGARARAAGLPGAAARSVMPWLTSLAAEPSWSSSSVDRRADRASSRSEAMEFLGQRRSRASCSPGVALLNLVSLIFVTPVVTFYMIRDWDRMVARSCARMRPARLRCRPPSAWRGRSTRCWPACIRGPGPGLPVPGRCSTASGLWLVGLNYGLIIGLLTGLFSFIPYIGMADRAFASAWWSPRSSSRTSGHDRRWSRRSSRSASSSKAIWSRRGWSATRIRVCIRCG